MRERKLYTAKEISEKEFYGPKEMITPYKITQNWAKKGLKFIRGTRREMLFKLEWIDEFLENQAMENKRITNEVVNNNENVFDLIH